MTDRQPGAPGQFTMVMNGTTYTVTLTRDDQPIVEGTPYNKASVLPDDLAESICPNVTDPTPADALDGLRKKKYSTTLSSSSWSSSNSMYSQKISLSAIQADDNESVKCWPVFSGTKSTDEKIAEAAACVSYAKTASGSITFTCISEKPTADIPIIVEVSH